MISHNTGIYIKGLYKSLHNDTSNCDFVYFIVVWFQRPYGPFYDYILNNFIIPFEACAIIIYNCKNDFHRPNKY